MLGDAGAAPQWFGGSQATSDEMLHILDMLHTDQGRHAGGFPPLDPWA